MKRAWIIAGLLSVLMPLGAAGQELPPFEEPEVSIFLEKHGRGRAQQGMALWGRYLFSCEDGGHVNIYDFKKADPEPIGGFELASAAEDASFSTWMDSISSTFSPSSLPP